MTFQNIYRLFLFSLLVGAWIMFATTANAMSHGLTESDSMVYVGKVPWHGLGKDATNHPRMIRDTDGRALGLGADDMFDLAFGADFHVDQHAVYELMNKGGRLYDPEQSDAWNADYFADLKEDPIFRRIDSHVSQIRDDNDAHLGIVGRGFGNLQARDLLELPAKVVGEAGIGFETAGSLWGGRTVWALANLGSKVVDTLPDGSPDVVNMHVLFKTGFDGKTASVAMLTPIRVVCANTLAFAMHYSRRERAEFSADELSDMKAAGLFGRPGMIKWKHRGDQAPKLENATSILLGLNQAIDQEVEVFAALAEKQMSVPQMRDFADAYLTNTRGKVDNDSDPRIQLRRNGQRDALVGYFATSPGNAGRHHWDAFNGVTYFEEHSEVGHKQRGAKGLSDEENAVRKATNRFEAQTDGTVVDRRGEAIKLLVAAA